MKVMSYTTAIAGALLLLGMVAGTVADAQQAGPRILLLTRSAGFEHSVIKRDDSGTSHVERILKPLVQEMGATLECTKDAGKINAESLKNYDVVIFYTSGDMTQPGGDGQPAMAASGVDDLLAWIKNGGGFLGFHSATDSFRSEGDDCTPYIQMIGAEFVKHGAQFKGTIKKVDAGHPAVASLPEAWNLADEWYLFRKFAKEDMHVLALLEIGKERQRQDVYNIPDYPMIWCRGFGNGRVLYNGMGHREDVWEHDSFKALVKDHIQWVSGKGELNAEPNYTTVVPATAP